MWSSFCTSKSNRVASQDFRLVSATPARPWPTAREYRQQWAKKLSSVRARSEATSSTQGDFGLDDVANLLLSLPEADLAKIVIRKFAQTRAVYVDGTTLHIHTLRLCKKDEVNSILLATHFGVVNEIRIHNFHLYCYLFRGNVHVSIAQSHWGAMQTVLSYVSERFGEEKGRPIKSHLMTFCAQQSPPGRIESLMHTSFVICRRV